MLDVGFKSLVSQGDLSGARKNPLRQLDEEHFRGNRLERDFILKMVIGFIIYNIHNISNPQYYKPLLCLYTTV